MAMMAESAMRMRRIIKQEILASYIHIRGESLTDHQAHAHEIAKP